MKKRLAKMPSPAMAVAFLALLAALAGTAVALPGSNTVTTGDIRTGAVRTADIRNSTIRGRDVRNNTLTGSDVNENSLGTVPSARAAGFANAATAATAAGRANSAASVDKLIITNRVGRAFGDAFASTSGVLLATKGPFSLRLLCDEDAGEHFSDLILVGPAGSFAQDGFDNLFELSGAPDNFVLVSSIGDAGTGASQLGANLSNAAMTAPTGQAIQARGYTGINVPGSSTECVGGGTLEG